MSHRIPSPAWRDEVLTLRDLLDLNAREAAELIAYFGNLDNALGALDACL